MQAFYDGVNVFRHAQSGLWTWNLDDEDSLIQESEEELKESLFWDVPTDFDGYH